MSEVTVEDVVRGYVKLRDRKNDLKKKHTEELKPINEKMQMIEGWLLRDMTTRKVESEKTKEGTAYVMTDSRTPVRDRDALLKFIIENEMWDLFENRVSKSVVMDYLEETGEVIPGVSVEQTKVVRVRR